MSVYFSKYMLNTCSTTPYFLAQLPEDFPLSLVLQQCRAFRRLPPVLKDLAEKAREWAVHTNPSFLKDSGIDKYYDDEGYELDPGNGKRLTDEQIDELWDDDRTLDKYKGKDIPKPPGGFPDPKTWEADAGEEDLVDRSGLTEDAIEEHIASRGLEATAREYGVPAMVRKGIKNSKDCVRAVMDMDGKPWPKSAAVK